MITHRPWKAINDRDRLDIECFPGLSQALQACHKELSNQRQSSIETTTAGPRGPVLTGPEERPGLCEVSATETMATSAVVMPSASVMLCWQSAAWWSAVKTSVPAIERQILPSMEGLLGPGEVGRLPKP
jgi:hypothetical protein